jgi:hypothetical protein
MAETCWALSSSTDYKRLVAREGTSEFSVSSASVIMTSIKLYLYIHYCKHSFQLNHERILVTFRIFLKRKYETLDVSIWILIFYCYFVHLYTALRIFCTTAANWNQSLWTFDSSTKYFFIRL